MEFVHTCPLTKKKTIVTGDLIKETNTTYILTNAIVRGERKKLYSGGIPNFVDWRWDQEPRNCFRARVGDTSFL